WLKRPQPFITAQLLAKSTFCSAFSKSPDTLACWRATAWRRSRTSTPAATRASFFWTCGCRSWMVAGHGETPEGRTARRDPHHCPLGRSGRRQIPVILGYVGKGSIDPDALLALVHRAYTERAGA